MRLLERAYHETHEYAQVYLYAGPVAIFFLSYGKARRSQYPCETTGWLRVREREVDFPFYTELRPRGTERCIQFRTILLT